MSDRIPAIHFDTEASPEQDPFESWRSAVVGFSVERLNDGPPLRFRAQADAYSIGALAVILTDLGAGLRFQAFGAPDQPRNVSLVLMIEGLLDGEAAGREYAAGRGEIVAFDWRQPVVADLSVSRTLTLVIPQAAIEAEIGTLPDLHGVVLGGAAGRLLTNYLLALAHELPSLAAAEADMAARATSRMIAACIEALAAQAVSDPILGPIIRRRVVRQIEARIGDRALSPALLTRDLGISRSTLYRAFAGDGGIAFFIGRRRLEAAHAALSDRSDSRSVKAIALAHGFSSPSHFNTAFRRRFGYRPLDARRGRLARSSDMLEPGSPAARLHAMVANLTPAMR